MQTLCSLRGDPKGTKAQLPLCKADAPRSCAAMALCVQKPADRCPAVCH